jgi:hypothetical protein
MEEHGTMTRVSIAEGKLAIEVQGWDRLWSLTSRLEIPLECVMDVRRADADDEAIGLRTLGTHVPGIITAGTFLQEGSLVFWDVHDFTRAVVVDLRDERYSKLVIEVAEPAYTISMIDDALTSANI